MDDTNELELLRSLLAECNKSLRQLEKENARLASRHEKLAVAVDDLLHWAEFNGAGYTVGPLLISNLRKARKEK